MAHKTDVAESTEKLSSAFAGRLAVGANDGCKALGISKTKWFELRKADPTFPRPFRIGSAVRYRVTDLVAWMNAQAKVEEVA
ncbi:helix-turn-helix transcriptional regulator [Sutterella wadsworthensis]|jgi:predicted DNA-binding transcriptional regulator AlpA|uniref:helix-turn-helix transcriptional regulator n=1 Tax=Sutterella wadsworthensis TaxID=40545 RepID=UPI0013F655CE|nr:helix-turn-helix domain-containing protein [Sutterella wadsworthensis]